MIYELWEAAAAISTFATNSKSNCLKARFDSFCWRPPWVKTWCRWAENGFLINIKSSIAYVYKVSLICWGTGIPTGWFVQSLALTEESLSTTPQHTWPTEADKEPHFENWTLGTDTRVKFSNNSQAQVGEIKFSISPKIHFECFFDS